MSGIRVGIDLGTCYSSVGYKDQYGIHFIQDPTAAQLTYSIPSSALLRQDDSLVFGELAESEKNVTPEGYRREFKRRPRLEGALPAARQEIHGRRAHRQVPRTFLWS